MIAPVVVRASLAAALSLGALAAHAQQPANRVDSALSRVIGNWQVNYQDAALGTVTGHAIVFKDHLDRLAVRYFVSHPTTKQRYELRHTSTSIRDSVLELEMFGESPSGAAEVAGGPAPRTISVGVGGAIRARVGRTRTPDVPVYLYANRREQVVIRLPLLAAGSQASTLNGQWVHLTASGDIRHTRAGDRVRQTLRSGSLETTLRGMRGAEIWTRGGPQIDTAHVIKQQPFVVFAEGWRREPTEGGWRTMATIRVEGRALPLGRSAPVVVKFEDTTITYTGYHVPDPDIPGALQIEVRIGRNTLPGTKFFTLNESLAMVAFDFAGLEGKVRHVRVAREDQIDAAQTLYLGELYQIEVEFPDVPNYNRRVVTTTASGSGESITFLVEKDRARPKFFRSRRFLLLGSDEPGPDTTRQKARSIMRALPGEQLRSELVDVEGRWMAVSDVAEIGRTGGRFQRALEIARDLRRKHPDADRYRISNFIATEGGSRSIALTVEDHAAMILLLQEYRQQVAEVVRAGPARWDSTPAGQKAREAFVESLINASRELLPEDPPLLIAEVPGPEGRGTMRLKAALGRDTEKTLGDTPEQRARFRRYANRSVAIAEQRMDSLAAVALAHLSSIDISKPTGDLLAAVKIASPSLAGPLARSLLRPSDPTKGEPQYPRLVADRVGRDAVMNIGTMLEAIRAQQAYSNASADVVLALTSLAPIGIGGLAVRGLVSKGVARAVWGGQAGVLLGAAGSSFSRAYAHSQNSELAEGTADITGANAFLAERAEMSGELWRGAFYAIDAVGVPLFLKAAELAVRPPASAIRTAVAEAARRGVGRLGKDTRQLFEYARGLAEYKAMRRGVGALDDFDREVLRLSYPNGIPADVASRLRIPPDDTSLPVQRTANSGSSSSETNGSSGAAVDPNETAVLPRPLSPEEDWALLRDLELGARTQARAADVRRLDEAARAAVGRGNYSEAFRLKLQQHRMRSTAGVSPSEEARALAAWNAYQELRGTNGQVAALDQIDVLDGLLADVRRARSSLGSGAVDAEDALAITLQSRGINLAPSELSRATGASPLNAEAAILRARRIQQAENGGALEETLEETIADVRPPSGPGGNAAPAPRPAPAPDPNAATTAAIEAEFKKYNIDFPGGPEFYGVRHRNPKSVVAGHLMLGRSQSASEVMAKTGIDKAELRRLLDEYLRDATWEPNAGRRAETVERLVNTEPPPPAVEPPPAPPPSIPPRRAAPTALDTRPTPETLAREQVFAALDKMNVPRENVADLVDGALNRVGGDPLIAAAGLSRTAGISPRAAAEAIGVNQQRFAGLLDQYQEAMLPLQSPTTRANEVARHLTDGGTPSGATDVLTARQARVEAALNDLGVPGGDAGLIAEGLDVESAIIGRAMEGGVEATRLVRARNLSVAKLREHVFSYLRYGRGITDATELRRIYQEFLAGRYTGAQARWRLPADNGTVVTSEGELARALEKLDVERGVATSSAASLREVAARDAHEALAGAALTNRIPPALLRERFGLSPEQVAQKMDVYLRNHIGLKSPEGRAFFIANKYFNQFPGSSVTPDDVLGMINRAQPADQALRPHSTRTFAAPAGPAPDPRPSTLPPAETGGDLTQRFGTATRPRAINGHERLPDGSVIRNPSLVQVGAGPLRLQRGLTYIWAVDEQGRLLMGVAAPRSGQPLQSVDLLGHVTLVNGGPARITGELYFDGAWVLNNRGGRYVTGPTSPHNLKQLQNVARIFDEAGLRVRVDFLPFQ